MTSGAYERWNDSADYSCIVADAAFFVTEPITLGHLEIGVFELGSSAWAVRCEATAWHEASREPSEAFGALQEGWRSPASRADLVTDLGLPTLQLRGVSLDDGCAYEWSLHLVPAPG